MRKVTYLFVMSLVLVATPLSLLSFDEDDSLDNDADNTEIATLGNLATPVFSVLQKSFKISVRIA